MFIVVGAVDDEAAVFVATGFEPIRALEPSFSRIAVDAVEVAEVVAAAVVVVAIKKDSPSRRRLRRLVGGKMAAGRREFETMDEDAEEMADEETTSRSFGTVHMRLRRIYSNV